MQVRFYESIAAQLAKPGTPLGATLQEAAGRAKPGDMPAGAAARQVTVVALIEKIDKKSQTVTFKGPPGNDRCEGGQAPDARKSEGGRRGGDHLHRSDGDFGGKDGQKMSVGPILRRITRVRPGWGLNPR